MKRKANRLKVETLYILGAGASKALTVVATRTGGPSRRCTPIDKDFLTRLDHFAPKTGWQPRSLELVTSNWLDASPMLDHGLEEAVIKRAAHYDMLSALYPDKSRRKCSNDEYLNHLTHLIAAHLMLCRSNSSGSTKQFANTVFPPGQEVDDYRNRVITFNYDLVLDRPLLERGLSKRKIYFDRIVRNRNDGIKRKSAERFVHPLMLKLHGSLNWRCDKSYFNEIINGTVDPSIRIPIWANDTQCPSPDDHECPLIIPPVPNKPITKASIFKMLWTTALEYLHEAKRIVIVGYSCPATDVLAQAMFTQFRNMGVSEITVVDPASDALSKYHALMKGNVKKDAKWSYFSSFHEFIAKMPP